MASPSIPNQSANCTTAEYESVRLKREHLEALKRATDILTALGDIISPCQEHDPFWLILRHVNNDRQWVQNNIRREVQDGR